MRDTAVAARAESLFIEVGFIGFFVLFSVVSLLRFAVASGSQWEYAVAWQTWEPIITDPSSFFRVQSWLYFYYLIPAAFAFVYALVQGGHQPAIRDIAYLVAGVSAQAGFCFMRCASHWNTAEAHRADNNANFWAVNIALFVVPQAFAYYVWSNQGFHGIANLLSKAK